MGAIDLTRGSIAGGILRFALPLLGTSVVQQLYTTVDLLFVGNVLGTAGAAALGLGSLLITLIATLFTGISVGVNVKIADLFGSGDMQGVSHAIRTALKLSIGAGAFVIVLGMILSRPFLDIMEVPSEAAADAAAYLAFAVISAFPIGVFNICAGGLRGIGDSRSPFVAQAAGGALNIAANWAALCVLNWGIIGCAAATCTSNALAATIAAVALARCKPIGADGGRRAPFDRRFAVAALAFGAPVALQAIAIVLSNVLVQHQIDLLGVESVAAFTVYLKVELPIYFVILAIGQAATTFVAQNNGAGFNERCQKGIRICQILCFALAVVLSMIMLGIGPWAFGIFNNDAAVISIGLSMIWTTFPFYFLYAILEVQADAIRGFGHSLGPALIVLATICVLRVMLVYMFTGQGLGITAIAATYPITWGAAAIGMVLLRVGLRYAKCLHS